jgi:hypothetical protein
MQFSCAAHITETLKPIEKFVTVLDDRMYVICWYGNNEKISEFKQLDDNKHFNYENSRDWYMFSFIDGNSAGIGNDNMRKKLISDITYPRFVEDGTLYGVTRYSFVCLTSRNDYTYSLMRNHMQKMYYQMVILLLVQRASILVFNTELSTISTELDKDDFENTHSRIEILHKQIIQFSNRLWFEEISPQEQGIELYQLALKNMNTTTYYNNLKEKIDQTYSFADLKLKSLRQTNDSNIAKTVAVLSSLGAIYLPATFVAALWAMQFYFTKFIYEIHSPLFNSELIKILRHYSYVVSFFELIVTVILIWTLTSNILLKLQRGNKSDTTPFNSLGKLLKIAFDSKCIKITYIILILIILFHLIIFI